MAETVNIEIVAKRLGISRGLAYTLARADDLPVPVLRLGSRLLVPVAALDKLLGGSDEQGGIRA